jgi:hypothetical protein
LVAEAAKFIEAGKEKGSLTYAEVNRLLQDGPPSSEKLDQTLAALE